MSHKTAHKKTVIPIQQTKSSTFDEKYSVLREMFATEMKQIDEQMRKFSSDLMHLYGQLSTMKLGVTSAQQDHLDIWETLIASPLVHDDGDNKALLLKFDVSQFDPTEITVKIVNDVIVVSARHEEKTDSSSALREYMREFLLPVGTSTDSIVASLSRDGVLIVKLSLPKVLDEALPRPLLHSR